MGQIIDGAFYSDYDSQDIDRRLAIAGGVSNLNLLDNAWFTVNQRGTTTSSAYEYIADRWLADSTGITWSLDGVAIPANAGQAKSIYSIFETELSVGTYTASILTTDGTVYAATAEITNPSITKTFMNDVFEIDYIGSTKRFRLYNLSNAAKTIRAIKLEPGTISTLANDIAPDYTTELLKCQRYCYVLTAENANSVIFGSATILTSQYASVVIHTPVAMRALPTLSTVGGFSIQVGETITAINTMTLTQSSVSKTVFRLSCIVSGFTAGQAGLLESNSTGSQIILSADL